MVKLFRQLTLPLILALLVLMLTPLSVGAVEPTFSYENYTTGNDSSFEVWGNNYGGQTFTTNSSTLAISHTLTAIRLRLYKEGTPQPLTISVRECNATGYPLITEIASTIMDGELLTADTTGAWYDIPIDGVTFDVNRTYSIVCSSPGTNDTNCVHWVGDTAGATYTGGAAIYSTTGGLTYTALADSDFMFEVFGRPALEIVGANVFEGYVYEGDWLIVVEYKNMWEPLYSDDLAKSSFLLQLNKADGTLIGQVPMQSWDYYPGSVYLSNVTVASLDWGSAYNVTLKGIDSPYYNVSYTLNTSDWRGANLFVLDDWCRGAAGRMGAYYGTALTVMTAEKGEVLNELGGTVFETGIPYLSQIRPGLFQVALSGIPYTEPTWAGGYEGSLDPWQVAVGPELALILNDTGNLINLSGKDFGMLLIFLAYVGVAAGSFAVGHGMAGVSLALPILIIGVYFGFIPWAALGVGIAITVALWARQLWWSST